MVASGKKADVLSAGGEELQADSTINETVRFVFKPNIQDTYVLHVI